MIERERTDIDDQFALQLERVDRQLAGETPTGDNDTQAAIGSADFDAAKRVLGLINRVRSAQSQANSGTDVTLSNSTSQPHGDHTTSVPDQIGTYDILGQVGRGGMGVVFRARDRSLNRVVALKMMLAGPFAYAEERSRFRIEAEAAAALDHPGIVPVYEVGEHGGQPFFTMGLIEGESLAQRISEEPLKPQAAAAIARQVASAVAYAHGRGVVHRDIKPANILLDQNQRPRITDFGLARRRDSVSDLTATEQVLGTPSYMAPEQASGGASGADERADVYSIGATLYCMLTARPPFQGHNAAETVRLVVDRDPVAPRQLNPAIPIDLNTICIKCLQKDPDRRYRDAASLESDLQRFIDGNPIQARPVGIFETVWKWSRRHLAVAVLTCCCLLAAFTLVAGSVWYQSQLNRTLIDLKRSRGQTVRSLYRAFTNEAEYLSQVRPVGYGERIEQLVAKAKSLDTDVKDLNQLRQLLVSSLGHVGAREPVVLERLDAEIRTANVCRQPNHLIVGLENGTLVAFDLESETKVFEATAMSNPITRIDVDLSFGDGATRYVRAIGQGGSAISHWFWDGRSYSRAEQLNPPNLPEGFFGIDVSPDARHIVGLESASSHLLDPNVWHTRGGGAVVSEPERRPDGLDDTHFSIASFDPSRGFSVRQSAIPVSPRFDLNNGFLALGRSWLDEKSIEDDLQVYDLNTDRLVQSINASVGALQNVRLSPDGRFVACGGYFGVEVFAVGSGERIAKHDELGRCTVVSFVGSDGDVLVRTPTETVWLSARYGQSIVKLAADTDRSSVCLSADGRSAVWIGGRRPRVATLQGDQRRRISAHNLIVETVCLSPDGQLLLSTGRYYGGNETKVWNVETGELAFEFIGAASTFSPDGALLAAWNGRLQLWEVGTGVLVAEGDCDATPSRIAFSDSGEMLLAVGNFAGQSLAWRVHSRGMNGAEAQSTPHPKQVRWELEPVQIHPDVRKPATLSPSGRRLAFASNGGIVVDDIQRPGATRVLQTERRIGPDSLVFLDETRLFFVADDGHLWNLDTNEVVRTQGRHLQPPVLLSPDGRQMFCGRQLIRTADFEPIVQLPDWSNAITSATWSRDGRLVAYGLDGGDIAVWDLAAVREKLVESGFPGDVIMPGPTSPIDAVSAMLRVGRQRRDRIHPRQWRYKCNQLAQWIETDSIDRDRVHRRIRDLTEQLDRIGGRPFFDSTEDSIEHLLDAALQLNQELSRVEHVEAQRLLLTALSDSVRRQPPRSTTAVMRGSHIHHLLGDLLNFQFQENEDAVDAYREEARLLEDSESAAAQAPSHEAYASQWFWLYRNKSLALARDARWADAIAAMTRALEIQAEFESVAANQQTLGQDRELLEKWREQVR
ncbi:serine/threonine-protein kinase [Stieleria sp. ICT_E10.1]|uniref:WD40 repeat domain-containing serine/threonine protein kinase n=1 Tax=Stieleria sedimenti TaxID=2976331 RepID=UPI0021800AC8|nr:serine/threonine-protein kinase [Stieleria sedimenti]MCS7465419.1 serine/threonine-protein kinase [Stieleria sedimenti]